MSATDQLKAFVERIERLESEKAELASDIRELYAEAKGNGYDVKALREIVKLRKQDTDERRQHEAVVDTYKLALGMIADLPLGEAAIARAAKPSRAAALCARPDDKVITETIPIPAQPIRSANQAGIGPASPLPSGMHECTDGAGPSHSESVPDDTPTASNSSAPPRERLDFGGADDLSIPGFLRRTADNRVPA